MKKGNFIPNLALGTLVAIAAFALLQLVTAGPKVNKNPVVVMFYLIIGLISIIGGIRMFSRWKGGKRRSSRW